MLGEIMTFSTDAKYQTEKGGVVGPLWDLWGFPKIITNTIADWDRETGEPINAPARDTWGRLISNDEDK
jgi:hypothetical protein